MRNVFGAKATGLKTSRIIKITLKLKGSQCKVFKIAVMCAIFLSYYASLLQHSEQVLVVLKFSLGNLSTGHYSSPVF